MPILCVVVVVVVVVCFSRERYWPDISSLPL
jgi:hypothetical protein